jgi:hypothetical protein
MDEQELMIMKKILSSIWLLAVLSLLPVAFSACGSDSIRAVIGKEFNLPVGDTAVIKDEQLTIRFVEVTSDSRCPSDVVCIQMGEAECLTIVNYEKLDYQVILKSSGNLDNRLDFDRFTIIFNLLPYPAAATPITPDDYYLVITVKEK